MFGYPGWVMGDACKSAQAASSDGDLSCLGAARLGPYVCQANAGSLAWSNDAVAAGAPDLFLRWRQLGTWLYRLNCTAPVPVRTFMR
jgi:hypothetical protein